MLSLAALLLVAAPATASQPAAQPADAAKEKKICRRQQSVGTRFGPTVCMTRARWSEMASANREDNRRVLQDSERATRDAWTPYPEPK